MLRGRSSMITTAAHMGARLTLLLSLLPSPRGLDTAFPNDLVLTSVAIALPRLEAALGMIHLDLGGL